MVSDKSYLSRAWIAAVLSAGMFAFSGCSLKEFKSTPFYEGDEVTYNGDASERINLWPIAYWHDPEGSVAWPLLSFSEDLFAVRPIYSQYKQDGAKGEYDEFNFLWPLAQFDLKHKDNHIFPFFWGSTYSGKPYQAVFPFYWNGPTYNALFPLWIYNSGKDKDDNIEWWRLSTLGGLAGGSRSTKGYRATWCFPLWYENSDGLFATALYGRTPESYWVLPLWYSDSKTFVSLPFSYHRPSEDVLDWAVPGLLSWGRVRRDQERLSDMGSAKKYSVYNGKVLLGQSGWSYTNYQNAEGETCGHNIGWWAWPLVDYWHSKPAPDVEENRKVEMLGGLAGWKSDNGSLKEALMFPLFSWIRDYKFHTLLGGYDKDFAYATPFVGWGLKDDESEGWVFPFGYWYKRGSKEVLSHLDWTRLPDSIEVEKEVSTNRYGEVEFAYTSKGKRPQYDSDILWFFLSDNNHLYRESGWNCKGSKTNTYSLSESRDIGNALFFRYSRTRYVKFDLLKKDKLSDEEEEASSFLVWLYTYEHEQDRMANTYYKRHSVLWKIWDWEETEDGLSLDVFPGFTCDTRKDGFFKTSFLWRFFRYEKSPDKDSPSIDFLFLPIWRP